jgi:hypothetical protein
VSDNVPYRWNLVRRDRLGTLPGGAVELDRRFVGELVECAAKVLARSGDGDLYFVGRAADSVHDLLSGALAETRWRDRVHLLPFSYRFAEPPSSEELRQMWDGFRACGVSPYGMARRSRPIVFADLVHAGHTFASLYRVLREWIADERETWDVIRLKLRFLGITARTKTSPKTDRWWQRADWVAELPRRAVVNVSVDPGFWAYLGDYQPKLTPSMSWARWAGDGWTRPQHDDLTRAALAQAAALVEHGRTREVRQALARRMAAEPAFAEPWLRSLIVDLRR